MENEVNKPEKDRGGTIVRHGKTENPFHRGRIARGRPIQKRPNSIQRVIGAPMRRKELD